MKKVYWHPHNLPRVIIIAFCLFVLAGLYFVEHDKNYKYQHYYKEKLQAAKLTKKAFQVIHDARVAHHIPIDASNDPQLSGLIGEQLTPITSDSGDLKVKQTTINPNIAALFVDWLERVKAKPGDTVAVNMTGSFPALDIAMLAAIKTMQLKPLITFSAAASQYGANMPYFSWLDMYAILVNNKIFDFPVLGASLGGGRDNGHGVDPAGINILKDTIKTYGYPFIASQGTIDSINKRMSLYATHGEGQPIAAYINVGGNMASIGLKRVNAGDALAKNVKPHSLETGVVDKLPVYLANTDSVAVRFLKSGIAVINVHNIGKVLIDKYKFPLQPTQPVAVGTGNLFYLLEYNTWLAMMVLGLDVCVFIFIALLSKKYVIRYKR